MSVQPSAGNTPVISDPKKDQVQLKWRGRVISMSKDLFKSYIWGIICAVFLTLALIAAAECYYNFSLPLAVTGPTYLVGIFGSLFSLFISGVYYSVYRQNIPKDKHWNNGFNAPSPSQTPNTN